MGGTGGGLAPPTISRAMDGAATSASNAVPRAATYRDGVVVVVVVHYEGLQAASARQGGDQRPKPRRLSGLKVETSGQSRGACQG